MVKIRNDSDDEPEVYNIEELAGKFNVTPRTIWNWIRQGKIEAFKVSRSWVIRREAVDKLLKRPGSDDASGDPPAVDASIA